MSDNIKSEFLNFVDIIKTKGISEASYYLDRHKSQLINQLDSDDKSILFYITLNFHKNLHEYKELVQLLLMHGEKFGSPFEIVKGFNSYSTSCILNTGMAYTLHFILNHYLFKQFEILVSLGYKVTDFISFEKCKVNILHVAVNQSNYRFVEYLISNYSDLINSRDSNGNTALFYAISDLEMLKLLLKHGADMKIKNYQGKDLITYSIFKYKTMQNAVQLLTIIPLYTVMDDQTNILINLLNFLQKLQNLENLENLVKQLIDKYPPKNNQDLSTLSDTLVFAYSMEFSNNFMHFLLNKGADINHCFKKTCVLEIAIKKNLSFNVIKELISLGASTNHPGDITSPTKEIIYPVLKKTNDIESYKQSMQIIELFLENGLRFDKIYVDNTDNPPTYTTFLFEIVNTDFNEEVYDLIIEKSKNLIEFRHPQFLFYMSIAYLMPCITALSYALMFDDISYAKKLVEHGASLETPIFYQNGEHAYDSPLDFTMNHLIYFNFLDKIVPFFEFLYHYKKRTTVFSGVYIYRNIVNKLPGPNGECTLFYALGNSEKLFQFLLKHGANPNCVNSKGELILQEAVNKRAIPYINMLMEFGADPLKKNGDGINSIDLLVGLKDLMNQEQYAQIYSLLQNRTQLQSQRIESKRYFHNPNVSFYFDH